MIDTDSEPGAWADAIAHSPCMDVSDYVPAGTGQAITLTGQADD